MPNKIALAFQLFRNMGLRYTGFRIAFELQKRLGFFKKAFPTNPEFKKHISFRKWKDETVFLIPEREQWKGNNYGYSIDRTKIEKMKVGIFEYFSSTEYNLGVDYDWITNPDTGFKYDSTKHWTDINDYDSSAGDIKYVWEKSRFSFVYAFIREDIAHGTDNAAFVLNEIQSWIKANSVNQGPNYKCSQEISLRVINWTFALHFYRNSPYLTEELFDTIMNCIYWQLKHVRSNINFSRIAVRNNHAITETLMLYIGGLVYPFFPESEEWKRKGKKWFEEEVAYQVYPDGTFLQFSMNYHRVLVQLFNLSFLVSQKYNESFNETVYERAYKSLNFLFQCQSPENGMLPNYGANDGAIFFPLASCEYRDYRPSLNTLHFLLTGSHLYSEGPWREECRFFDLQKSIKQFPFLKQREGWIAFQDGGYYLLREEKVLTFLRCGSHKDRPSQADNLHLDIWVNGVNILIDGGSYKYNTESELLRYFMGTASHNTVMIDEQDQMLKGGRFIWYFWSQQKEAWTAESEASYTFSGSISAFRHLRKGIVHTRTVHKTKGSLQWIVTDTIKNKPSESSMRQLFHHKKDVEPHLKIVNVSTEDDFAKDVKIAFHSSKYGMKEEIHQVTFSTKKNTVSTEISISN